MPSVCTKGQGYICCTCVYIYIYIYVYVDIHISLSLARAESRRIAKQYMPQPCRFVLSPRCTATGTLEELCDLHGSFRLFFSVYLSSGIRI